MDVVINVENIAINPAMEKFIHEKLNRVARYLPNISHINVDIKQQKSNRGPDQISVQITTRHTRGAILRAEEKVSVTENLFSDSQAAVNLAIDKMVRRIDRFKGKKQDKRDRSHRYEATLEELNMAEEIPSDETGEWEVPDAEQQDARIFRRKVMAVSPMTEEEAIEQMELLGHTFFVFHHAERNRINVLYKRSNGGYGVLDPVLE